MSEIAFTNPVVLAVLAFGILLSLIGWLMFFSGLHGLNNLDGDDPLDQRKAGLYEFNFKTGKIVAVTSTMLTVWILVFLLARFSAAGLLG
jgi:hypothetical protein